MYWPARVSLRLLMSRAPPDDVTSGGKGSFCKIYMGLVTRKPVFGVSDKASFEPVSSATGTS